MADEVGFYVAALVDEMKSYVSLSVVSKVSRRLSLLLAGLQLGVARDALGAIQHAMLVSTCGM